VLRRLRNLVYIASVLLFGAAIVAWALTQRADWTVEWRHRGWTYRVVAGAGEFHLSGSAPRGAMPGSPEFHEAGALGVSYDTTAFKSGALIDWVVLIPLIYLILLFALIPLFGLVSFLVEEGRLRQTRGFTPLDVRSSPPATPVESDRM
jgi:hypothetical protein